MKKNRQGRILQLIQEENIETQEELAERLSEEGFVVKRRTWTYDTHLADKYIRVLRNGFVSMDHAQNILVIKTVAGMAMAVAAAVDAMKLKEIVGSIAGDDTIMAAIRTTEETQIVMEKIREML